MTKGRNVPAKIDDAELARLHALSERRKRKVLSAREYKVWQEYYRRCEQAGHTLPFTGDMLAVLQRLSSDAEFLALNAAIEERGKALGIDARPAPSTDMSQA